MIRTSQSRRTVRHRLAVALLAAIPMTLARLAHADESAPPAQAVGDGAQPDTTDDAAQPEQWAVHGQSTLFEMYHPAFTSPYRGPQSLDPGSRGSETFDATLYAGFRPWAGGELWINPEADQGFGLSNSFGVAGYLSGEAYKLGAAAPYYRMARAFFRQTIDLGGETGKVDRDLNQLGGSETADRLVITVGKIAVVDIFDTNKYAHDPRSDFANWSIIDAGAFDYAADAWGTTYGGVAELYWGRWAVRAGLFDLSAQPNDKYLENRLFSQFQLDIELEERHTVWNQPGQVKLLYWLTRGRLGLYSDALALAAATGTTPSTALVRNYRSKAGIVLNLEQQIVNDLGAFARLSASQGDVEENDFTDINRSLSFGLSLGGSRWNRPDDTVGLAAAFNQISHEGKLYLAAGGLGGIVGDGQLPQAGPEQILETYYSAAAFQYAHVTFDYQFVRDPAYARERGPVSVLGLRLHAEF
jgi:high affinity Mn2+ porin